MNNRIIEDQSPFSDEPEEDLTSNAQVIRSRSPLEEGLASSSRAGKRARRVSPHEDQHHAEDDLETVWSDCNLLALDGGGIRGYWSLLALKQLMDHIAATEMNHPEGSAWNSFQPQPYPEEASQIADSEEEAQQRRIAADGQPKLWLNAARRYLPCHYFDFIGGTSTGALIAIMLGRFRMPVLDCLQEYAKLGNNVFGNPGRLAKARMFLTKGTKYRTSDAEAAFKDVEQRRRESVPTNGHEISMHIPKFPSLKGMCQTFVTTLASSASFQSKPFIIRSYEFSESTNLPPAQKQAPIGRKKRKTTYGDRTIDGQMELELTDSRMVEEPHPIHMWEAARAATAASKLFKPQRVDTAGGPIHFEDAGIRIPNPVMEGIRQIDAKYGADYLGAVVSIGTAKADRVAQREAGSEYITATAERLTSIATDPGPAHDEAKDRCRRDRVPYFRLNPDDNRFRLQIVLDEWQPTKASGGTRAGARTLRQMSEQFNKWYKSNPQVAQYFRDCASELVNRRRNRANNPAKWERYVTGSHFKCQQPACPNQRKFTFKDEYEKHWRRRHEPHSVDPTSQLLEQTTRSRFCGWQYQKKKPSEKEPSIIVW